MAADPTERTEPRLAALDGIRGVAILLVIAHNAGAVDAGPSSIALKLWAVIANAGWVGVQLFFALSGFLITRILLTSKGAPAWLPHFYVRRVLRIVPLYFALLGFIFFIAPHIAALSVLAEHGSRSQLWYWSYLSNWVSPFGDMARALPHVWSLAVEEQFYLIWPLVILALSERATARVCVGLVLSALAVRVLLHAVLPPETANVAAYQFTVTRWDALAFGALVAIALRQAPSSAFLRNHVPAALFATAAVVLGALAIQRGLAPSGQVAEMVNLPLTGILSAFVVLACVNENGNARSAALQRALRRVLSVRALVWIGKYSYAIYIFHLPVRLVLRSFALNPAVANSPNARLAALLAYVAAVFAIAAALAFLSWNVLEKRVLALKRYVPMPSRGAP